MKSKLSDAASAMGKKGGSALIKKYGKEHMSKMGKLSVKSRREKKLKGGEKNEEK